VKAVTDCNDDDMVAGAISSDPLKEASVWQLEEHALTVSRFLRRRPTRRNDTMGAAPDRFRRVP